VKASINGVDIAYDDHGMGLPVIFLHAFPLNRSMWKEQISALLNDRRYRLVALDWRGFGESLVGGDISTMEQLTEDVVGLMSVLGIQQAVLCGLSMGGYVALALLRKYPERVRGLILADTRAGADSEEAKANRENMARLVLTKGTGAIADLQIPNLLSASTHQHRPLVEQAVRQMIDTAMPVGVAAAQRGMAVRFDVHDLLAKITCPTLVIVGEQDVLTPPSVAHEYAAQIPGSQVVVIPEAGHLSNLEQPEAFLSAMRNFLWAGL
jgi:3-oxoadipate enol-lactonase